MILHILCLVEILQVKQQPQKYYPLLQSQWGEYQSLRETMHTQTLCQALPSQIKYQFPTEIEISDISCRHFLSPTGDVTDKISKPMEALFSKKLLTGYFCIPVRDRRT